MSAFSNFMMMFFPERMMRMRQNLMGMQQQRTAEDTLKALSPFISRQEQVTTQTPFQAETFGPEDPLQQLQQQGQSGLSNLTTSIQQTPGLFNQRQAEGIAQLLSVPQTQGFGQALLQSVTATQEADNQIVEIPTGEYKDGTPLMQKFIVDKNSGSRRPIGPPAPRGSGVTVNVGDSKPLGHDASKWLNEKGENPSPMMTINQASMSGFRPITTEQRKSLQSASEAAPIFGDMIRFGFGSGKQKSLFPSDEKGMFSRGLSGAQSWLAGVSESDARISLYDSSRNAVVTGIARLVGQVGTLTDRDVDTVRNLLPTPGLTPDSVARQKFVQIANLLKSKGVPANLLSDMGFPQWALAAKAPEPPPGSKKVGNVGK